MRCVKPAARIAATRRARPCGSRLGGAGHLASPTQPSYDPNVDPLRFVYWQDGAFWLGYIEEFPDYLTQGESFEDLKAHLRDLYADISGGHIPAVRRTAALDVA